MRMSHARAMESLAPAAGPGRAAIVGLRRRTSAPVNVRCRFIRGATRFPTVATSPAWPAFIDFIAPPAQDAAPAPVMRRHPIALPSAKRLTIALSADDKVSDSAFRACGRLRVTMATPSSKRHCNNCTSLRRATRRVSQFYDARLAAAGLRSTQLAILVAIFRQTLYP